MVILASMKDGAAVHEVHVGSADPVPVSVTKVFTGPWGTKEPITIPVGA